MVLCIGCLLVSVPEIYGDSLKSYKTYYLKKNKQTNKKQNKAKQNKTKQEKRKEKVRNLTKGII